MEGLYMDFVAAKRENDYFTVLNDALLPLYLKKHAKCP